MQIKRKYVNLNLTTAEQYYLILFISVAGILLYLYLVTCWDEKFSAYKMLGIFADSLLIIFFCGLFRGRWKYLASVVPFILVLLVMALVLYYRNFNDFIPAPLYLRNQITDPIVLNSALSSIRAYDFLILIPMILPIIFVLKTNRQVFSSSNLTRRCLCWLGTIDAILWILPFMFLYIRATRTFQGISIEDNIGVLFPTYSVRWVDYYSIDHFTGYILKCVLDSGGHSVRLTDDDFEFIKSRLHEAASRGRNEIKHTPGGPNLLIIFVESLPYKILELPFAEETAPTLVKLNNDSSVIVRRLKSFAMTGRSSDAQFIYTTGLLPLREMPLVTYYANNDYPSLPKALNMTAVEIIGENKGLWAHDATSKSYGYSKLISNVAPVPVNQDSVIFSRALSAIHEAQNPFMITMSTISMHNPYKKAAVTSSKALSGMKFEDNRDYEYFQRLKHFDQCLDRFLTHLKTDGIYDDFTIIILGDHEIAAWEIPDYLHDDSVPFIVLNSTLTATRSSGLTQLDVFPSILDLMNVNYNYLGGEYRGLGKSIFTSRTDTLPHVITEEDFLVSEKIIKAETLKSNQVH